MRIEQYIQMMDYALWEVIENGPTLPKTQVVKGVTTLMPITCVEDKAQRRPDVKARSTLMMGILNEYQLKFNSIKDVKKLLEDIKKRFGDQGAKIVKGCWQRRGDEHGWEKKNQMINFEYFSCKLVSNVVPKIGSSALKYKIQKLVSQLKLLGEKLSQEDVNQKLLRSLSPEWNTHAAVWRNKADLDTMSMDDLYKNLKVYEPKLKGMSSSSKSTQNMAFVSSSNNNSTNGTIYTAQAVGVSTSGTQVNTANIDNLSDAVICAFLATQPSSPQLIVENYKKGLGYKSYNAVPPTYTDNFIPPKHNLSYIGLDKFVDKPVVKNCDAKTSETKHKDVRENNDALIIEEWVSDDEEEEGNVVNAVKDLACWVWKPKTKVIDHVSKHNSASITLNIFNYIDAQVIPETTNLPPIPEIATKTPVSIVVTSPQVTPIISSIQQPPTLIPTQPITTNAPTITTATPESNVLFVVELRVEKLKKDVSELKTVDHTSKALVVL
nr:hypothetical protein [Tanacetum cinerariifolium]